MNCNKERGLSAGFTASKGQRFAADLAAQRDASGQAVARLKARLNASSQVAAHEGFSGNLKVMQSSLDSLASRRLDVDALKLPAAEVIAVYNAAIERVMESCSGVLALAGNGGMALPSAAYTQLLRGKEIAGQERATLNGAFAAGKFSQELYRGWLKRVGAQEAYLKAFQNLGGHKAAALLESTLSGPDKEVERFRKLAFDNQDKPSLEADPQAWFAASTKRIDALKTVEDDWAGQLSARVGESLSAARRGFLVTLGIAVATAGIAALLGWLVFRSINAPLEKAVEFAKGVTSGDLEQTISLHRKDEIGQLCGAMEEMLGTIKEMIAKAGEASEMARREAESAREAAKAAEEAQAQAVNARQEGMLMAARQLEGVVTALNGAAAQLSSEVEQASQGAGVQSVRVAETATAMEEMNATVLEVARSASAAAQTSGTARQEAVSGAVVVRDAVAGITRARDDSLELKRHMSELDARSKDIGRIMGVISDIADQTNLLALNAATTANPRPGRGSRAGVCRGGRRGAQAR